MEQAIDDATAIFREVAKFLTAMILAHAQFVLRNMESVGRGPDSAIASGSASGAGVSLAVAPPSRAGVCGVNSITNVIHGGVTATVLRSSLPRPTHLQR